MPLGSFGIQLDCFRRRGFGGIGLADCLGDGHRLGLGLRFALGRDLERSGPIGEVDSWRERTCRLVGPGNADVAGRRRAGQGGAFRVTHVDGSSQS